MRVHCVQRAALVALFPGLPRSLFFSLHSIWKMKNAKKKKVSSVSMQTKEQNKMHGGFLGMIEATA